MSINITNDLSPYSLIVPCGISDRPVSTVKSLLIQEASVADPMLASHDLDEENLLEEYRVGLLEAFLEEFSLKGVPAESKDEILLSRVLYC